MPARTASTEGEAKTSPQTAAVSMPRADEAGVRRLVAGAAAGDQRDARAVPVGADHDADVRVAVEAGEAAGGERQRPSTASVTMVSLALKNWVIWSASLGPLAGGVEEVGAFGADLQEVARLEARYGGR